MKCTQIVKLHFLYFKLNKTYAIITECFLNIIFLKDYNTLISVYLMGVYVGMFQLCLTSFNIIVG